MANLLIIDDDVHVTESLSKFFSEAGHQVTVTHRGDEGMSVAQKTAPDLILLDVILPDLTGYQLCSRLRNAEKTASTPILMITGVAHYPNQQVFGMERGANEYILKPLDLVELGETVDRYLDPSWAPSQAPKQVITPMPTATPSPSHEIGKLRNFLRQAIQKSKRIP